MAETPPAVRKAPQAPAVRQYTLVSLLALLLVLTVLLDMGLNEWSLLPVTLGCLTLLLQIRGGPPLLLLSLAWVVLSHSGGPDPFAWLRYLVMQGRLPPVQLPGANTAGLPMPDLLLCAAVLVYSLGCYRVLSLMQQIFPVDSRRKNWARTLAAELRRKHGPKAEVPAAQEKRSAESVVAQEMLWLVGTALVWTLLSWVFWVYLSDVSPPLGFTPEGWYALVLFWLFGMGLILLTAVLGYLDQAGAGAEANEVYLQDQLWRESRGEQSRINRWLVGARLRWQRHGKKKGAGSPEA